jgi:hypothetical protein
VTVAVVDAAVAFATETPPERVHEAKVEPDGGITPIAYVSTVGLRISLSICSTLSKTTKPPTGDVWSVT